ncbi:hypothetical protein [Ancylobacter terrae]|uniref:hypothetical protein n=1 Tax=Ancylobacter sp. sgz301288 TaxID=3342077 RepID=UPI00385CD788
MTKIATDDLFRSLIEIRDAFEEMPLPMAIMLLAVERWPGSSSSELGRLVNAPKRHYFRQLQRLGKGDHTGPGLNLVAAIVHPDGRANAIYLTRAGEKVLARLRAAGRCRSEDTDGDGTN